MLHEELIKRQNQLQEIIATCNKKLKIKYPEGSLRLTTKYHGVQFYWRKTKTETNGVYLKKHELDIASGIAQKDYYTKLLEEAQKEQKVINYAISKIKPNKLEDIYGRLHEARKALITPVLQDDASYLEEWQSRPYKGRDFAEDYPVYLTNKGERVRSKSEVIIANRLQALNIPYKYECPVNINGYGDIYPDFTILDVKHRREIYLEHFGMMDDPSYVSNFLKKQSTFINNGLIPGKNLFMTFESRTYPLSVADLDLLLQEILG